MEREDFEPVKRRVLAMTGPGTAPAVLAALGRTARLVLVGLDDDLGELCAGLRPSLVIIEWLDEAAAALRGLRADARLRGLPVLALGGAGRAAPWEALDAGATEAAPQTCRPTELAKAAERLMLGWSERAGSVTAGPFQVDTVRMRATAGARTLLLSTAELLILAELADRKGAFVSKRALAAALGKTSRSSHAVECHVSNLRRKLGGRSRALRSLPGGYCLDV